MIQGYSPSSDPLNVYNELIHTKFREGYTLQKGVEFERLTFGQLKQDNSKIEDIYQLLRKHESSIGQRLSTSSRDIELPFDLNKKIREDSLCDRFRQVFNDKEIEGYTYRLIPGYFGPEQKHPEEYPFLLEVFLVESKPKYKIEEEDYDDDDDDKEEDEDEDEYNSNEKKLHLSQSVNFSPTMYLDSLNDEDSDSEVFVYQNNDDGKIETSYGIKDILRNCGYDTDNNGHRRLIDYAFVNLISPRIEYIGGGKVRLELKPFGSVGQGLYDFIKSPKLKGKPKNSKDPMRQELKDLIYRERHPYKIATGKLNVKDLDPWDQSHIFYTLRVILIDKGYENVDASRQYITSQIKSVCWEIGIEVRGKGFKRHELGINAAERAQLYSDNKVYGVTFVELEELMKKGTDLLVIEKESIANLLMSYANAKGVSILNTRGFLVENAEELADLAEKEGCNIAILTDWDSSGLVIASKLPKAYRIGIDEKTLEKLKLDKENVEEKVQPQKKKGKKKKKDTHLPKLKKISQDQIPKPYTKEEWNRMVRYLEENTNAEGKKIRKRIEINSVITAVGKEKLWDYIKEELERVFTKRDYNRAISIPEYVIPEDFELFQKKVIEYITEFQKPIKEGWMERLRNNTHKGLLDVNLYKKIIEEEMRNHIDEDEFYNWIKEEFKMSFD
jgi:5S rRNA maturation endonuclease (ribonuclease M5)